MGLWRLASSYFRLQACREVYQVSKERRGVEAEIYGKSRVRASNARKCPGWGCTFDQESEMIVLWGRVREAHHIRYRWKLVGLADSTHPTRKMTHEPTA